MMISQCDSLLGQYLELLWSVWELSFRRHIDKLEWVIRTMSCCSVWEPCYMKHGWRSWRYQCLKRGQLWEHLWLQLSEVGIEIWLPLVRPWIEFGIFETLYLKSHYSHVLKSLPRSHCSHRLHSIWHHRYHHAAHSLGARHIGFCCSFNT